MNQAVSSPGKPTTTATPMEAIQPLLDACAMTAVEDPAFGLQPRIDETAFSETGFVSPLTELAVIRVAGPERLTFLQGQLTNDIEQLSPAQAQYTGFCSPKGRLLASFLAIQSAESVDLIVSRDIAAAVARRLSMYVLRAKVTVTDESASTFVLGLAGPQAPAALGQAGIVGADAVPAPMRAVNGPQVTVLGLSPVEINNQQWPRMLVLAGLDGLGGYWEKLSQTLPVRGTDAWRATEILAGTARISAPIQETFVPQMVNFELIGGVDFEKGCFTGQEVIARSQHLGKMKRRMFLGSVPGIERLAPGTQVSKQDKAVGTVVSSAPALALNLSDQTVVLFEASVDSATDLSIDGRIVTPMALPYDIPEPTPFERPRL